MIRRQPLRAVTGDSHPDFKLPGVLGGLYDNDAGLVPFGLRLGNRNCALGKQSPVPPCGGKASHLADLGLEQ